VQPEPVAELAPEPAPPEQPAPAAEPEPAPPSAADTRIEQLESQLHAVLTERNSLAQSFNELQTRLSEAAQAHEAGVSAEVQERVGALEAQLQAAAANREELERAQQQAAERIAELEGRLAETAENRHELDTELQTLRTIAAGRDAALEKAAVLEAELEQLRAHGNEDSSSQLQELAQQREAADARAHALENDLAQLREQTESEAARAAALEAELAALREQSSGHDENLAAQVSGLNEALQALTVERDAALQRAAALEPEVESLRDQLRDASAHAPVDGSHVDVSELQRQLAARERRLAESVGEIAKMNREHRALLQLVERQFQLEETTTSIPEPRGETAHVLFVPSATGYTLVERDGIAPEAGDIVEVDGGRYIVRRHGPSPLPGPRRRCAYLERA
jgi:chromosome segregation ATPase